MTDKLFAFLGLLGFAIFCAILIAFVPHLDLVAVVVLVLLMVAFDFIRELIMKKDRSNSEDG